MNYFLAEKSLSFFFGYETFVFLLISKIFIKKLKYKTTTSSKNFTSRYKSHFSIFRFIPLIKKQFFLTDFQKNKKSLFVGKSISVEGYILQVEELKQCAFAMLIECNECSCLFYCFFDSFVEKKPFMCIKHNCKSKHFFFHSSKLCTILWRKIRLQKEGIDESTTLIPDFIDAELIGEKSFLLTSGQFIRVHGILKIQKFNNKFKKITSFFKNVFSFYILGQYRSIKSSMQNYLFARNFLTKSEYKFFNNLKEVPNLFGICVKSMDFLVKGNYGFKAAVLILLSFNDTTLKKPFVFCFNSDDRFSKQNNLLKKLSYFTSNGFILQEKLGKDIFEISQKTIKNNDSMCIFQKSDSCLFYQSVVIEDECFVVEWIDSFKNFLHQNSIQNRFQNIVFLELRTKTQFHLKKRVFFSRFDFRKKISKICNSVFYLSNPNYMESRTILHDEKKPQKININGSCTKQFSYCRRSLFRVLVGRFSYFILRRYLFFVQNTAKPIFSDEAKTFLSKFYLYFRNLSKKKLCDNYLFSIETIIIFSESRTKIDLRNIVTENDLIDVMEILSDSKLQERKVFERFLYMKSSKYNRKLYEIYRFIRTLRKIFSEQKCTLFDWKEFDRNTKSIGKCYGVEEYVNILSIYGSIKKVGKTFFQLIPC